MNSSFLQTPIEYLKGVGPQRASMLKSELRIFTYGDLLTYYPYRYIDKSKFYNISELNAEMPYVQIKGILSRFESVGDKRSKRLIAYFKDETGFIELIWFQGVNSKYLLDSLKPGSEYIVFGKVNDFKGRLSIVHPEMELNTPETKAQLVPLFPMYHTSEKMKLKGLDSRAISKLMKLLVGNLTLNKIILDETLTPELLQHVKLLGKTQSIVNLHFPQNNEVLQRAIYRIKFEELFFIQVKLLKNKKISRIKNIGHYFSVIGRHFNNFYNNFLPFELTGAQKRVLKEIRADAGRGIQMNRLLQGDVGSGKTCVALMSMLMAIDNGYQACLMAPTEILATQHYHSIMELVKDMELDVMLLTGSTKTKERRVIHEKLLSGELPILIGTHALIEEVVQFKNLGLVVIDEQHRFGVEQRFKLWKKNTTPPHILVMTATPIPRTLAMTLYGDLDISIIDELPPGRKSIKTTHEYDSKRQQTFEFILKEIKLGRQAYIVFPLIEESDKLSYENLTEGFARVNAYFEPYGISTSMVHGQMKPAEKEAEMQRFLRGEKQIMVATTVIEVGVNVPNASVMLIESAERFGLSQLHQLRGRVGRGADQSYCILMTSYKLGADTKLRLETMVRTNDGFEISEVDLRLRGPGDIQGTQQSGMLNLKLADLTKDGAILTLARHYANLILDEDPMLQKEENKLIAKELYSQEHQKTNWSKIS